MKGFPLYTVVGDRLALFAADGKERVKGSRRRLEEEAAARREFHRGGRERGQLHPHKQVPPREQPRAGAVRRDAAERLPLRDGERGGPVVFRGRDRLDTRPEVRPGLPFPLPEP